MQKYDEIKIINMEKITRKKKWKLAQTMSEFQGRVERSSLKSSVKPISVTTHLSLSPSIIVRSKSKTIVIPAIRITRDSFPVIGKRVHGRPKNQFHVNS